MSKPWLKLLIAVSFYSVPFAVRAQKLTFGAIAGTNLTGDFENGTYHFPGGMIPDGQTVSSTWAVRSGNRQFIIGPKLELKLTWNLSVEAEALHRALHSTQGITESFSGGSQVSFGSFKQTHASWEFPVLVKYRSAFSLLSPFVEAGASFRPAGTGTNVTHVGATAGTGVELHARGFNISPGFRFTHWRAWPGSQSVPVAIQNQVEFLVGFDQTTGPGGWATGFGKKLSVGVLAGVGLGDDLKTATTFSAFSKGQRSDANSPVAAVLIEFALYRELYLEADGLYRPLHATNLSTPGGDVRYAVLTWEFPVMAKHKFRPSTTLRPFAELGPSFRLDGNFNGPLPSHYGVTGGVGLEGRAGRLKISPAIRYTGWGKERSPQGGGTFRNEVETVVGFAF